MLTPYLTTLHGVLYQADCLELMGSLNSEIVDCIFADPPLIIGKDYKNKYNDRKYAEKNTMTGVINGFVSVAGCSARGEPIILCFTGYSH